MGTKLNLAGQSDQTLSGIKIPAGGTAGDVWTLTNPATGAGVWTTPSNPPVPPPPAGMELWVDFGADSFSDAGITPCVDNDPIYQSNDTSGNVNNMIQAILASRPIFKTGIINGLPIARFDGIDDYMEAIFAAPLVQPTTIFLVANFLSVTSVVFDGTTGCVNRHAFAVGTPGSFNIYAGLNIVSPNQAIPSKFTLISVVVDGIYGNIYRDGVSIVTGDVGTDTWGAFRLGAACNLTVPAQVDVAEAIIYNQFMTNTERKIVENYLMNKYQL